MTTYDFNSYNSSQEEKTPISITSQLKPPKTLEADYNLYIKIMESLVKKTINKELSIDAEELYSQQSLINLIKTIEKKSPIITSFINELSDGGIAIITLTKAEHTEGIGRYIADTISRWLIPGKITNIISSRSLSFFFEGLPSEQFYIVEYTIMAANETEKMLIQKQLPSFYLDVRLNLLSVSHARNILSMHHLSSEQQSTLIANNISTLMGNDEQYQNKNAFDQMQNFLVKISAEKRLSQVHNNIEKLMNKRSNIFDRSIFESMQKIIILFKDHFTMNRSDKHISRIVAFHYLMKKSLESAIKHHPNKRHCFFKLLFTKKLASPHNTVIGIVLSINLLDETERFEKKHFLRAITNSLPNISLIKKTLISDKSSEKYFSYYIEIEKADFSPFSQTEIAKLKNNLKKECHSSVENLINSIFLPHNNEEMYKNFILLSKQIKYVKDIPQLIIHYDRQKKSTLSFNIYLVRLLKKKTPSMKELILKSNIFNEYEEEERKIIGKLKNRYPKEALSFRITINKDSFFRKDYSIDVQKARRLISQELHHIIGPFRDYNGGMISKQEEALYYVKKELSKQEQAYEDYLDHFFYSIKPAIMTDIIDPKIIKTFFMLYLDLIQENYVHEKYLIKTLSLNQYFMLMVGTEKLSIKYPFMTFIQKKSLPNLQLTYSLIETGSISCVGCIYKTTDNNEKSQFYTEFLNTIENWSKSLPNQLENNESHH